MMFIDPLHLLAVATALASALAILLLIMTLKRGASLRRSREVISRQHARLEEAGRLIDRAEAQAPALDAAREEVARLTTRLEERDRQAEQQRAQLEHEFRSMTTRLVQEAGDTLLREAQRSFDKHHVSARKDAESYSQAVGDLLKPMKDTLVRYEAGLRDMRDQQRAAQGALNNQITTLAQSANAVQAEAQALSTALSSGPQARGRWGETTLRNVVEMAGLAERCDFYEQQRIGDADAKQKQPDLVVRLPGNRLVAIDSKVSLIGWLEAAEAEDEIARGEALSRHAKSVWTHVLSLSAKDYAGALKKDGAIDFVVMFIPGDNFFSGALEARQTLFEDAFEKGVLIATPTTLVAILKSIAYAWRQHKAHENAHAVASMAADLYDALQKTGAHIADLGRSLDRSMSSYNKLVGNMESRVLPKARRFSEYEMPGTEKPLDPLPTADEAARKPNAARGFLLDEAVG